MSKFMFTFIKDMSKFIVTLINMMLEMYMYKNSDRYDKLDNEQA